MKDRRILVTGVTGKAVLPVAAALAKDNLVFGQARFADPDSERRVAASGIMPCRADLMGGDFDALPSSVDYVLHFAWTRAPADQLDAAMRANVDGAGLLLNHYRKARAALIVSSSAVYRGRADPLHAYREDEPIGSGPSVAAATSAVCKIALESVARVAARSLSLPVTIARLNTVVGPHQAFYGKMLQAVLNGEEIILPDADSAHNPIHSQDMITQIEPLLDAAGTTAPTINWSGDDVALSKEVIARFAARTGRSPRVSVRATPGLAGGSVTSTVLRTAITGPCRVGFDAAIDQMLDEMLDGAAPSLPQRDWGYASQWQNHRHTGSGSIE